MKKTFFVLALTCFSSATWAKIPAPNGTYNGTGQLIRYTDGTSFSYKVTYVIGTGSVTATYVYPDGTSYSLPFTTKDTTLGQFNVLIEGQQAGTGYCVNTSCHVDVSFPLNGTLETDALDFTYLGDETCSAGQCRLIISGKNATTNTAFQDIVKH